MILQNQFWGLRPSAHDSGFPRRRGISAKGEEIILCIMLCVFVYLARTFVSHTHNLFICEFPQHLFLCKAFVIDVTVGLVTKALPSPSTD